MSALVLAAFLLLAGCAPAPPPGPDPEAVAQAYLTALKAGDYQTCYRMLAENDLVHGSLGGFLGQIPMAPDVERRWFGQIEAATEYRVGAAAERGGEAIVPVGVTTPNLVLWERMLGADNQTRPKVQAMGEKQLAEGNYPRLSYADQIVMVREEDGWRLLAGVAQRDRIARLHDQALTAYHQFEYDQAVRLYRQMLERLAKAPFTASGELTRRLTCEMKTVEAARASATAARGYLPKLVLKDIEAKPTLAGAPGMFGQIVNAGDRALDEVEVTVSYYSNGKLVYAEKHTPVAIPLEFTDFDRPIAPFGPGQTRAIGIKLNAPPEIQQENKAQMTVSGLIFSEPPSAPPKLAGHRIRTADSAALNAGSRAPAAPAAKPN